MALTAPLVPAENIEAHYNTLNQIGAVEYGFHRPAYSDAETAAMAYIEQAALAGGLLSRWDKVGNLIIETPGDHRHWVETGSHMDTVPAGGNYDGTAGVVAGLEAILAIHRDKPALSFGLRLRIWRDEESAAFGEASIGSQVAFGLLNPDLLNATNQGQTLAQAMDSFTIYIVTLLDKPVSNIPRTIKRVAHILFVNQAHQHQVLRTLSL